MYLEPSHCKCLLQGWCGIILESICEHNLNVKFLYLAFLYLNVILFFGLYSFARFHVLSNRWSCMLRDCIPCFILSMFLVCLFQLARSCVMAPCFWFCFQWYPNAIGCCVLYSVLNGMQLILLVVSNGSLNGIKCLLLS